MCSSKVVRGGKTHMQGTTAAHARKYYTRLIIIIIQGYQCARNIICWSKSCSFFNLEFVAILEGDLERTQKSSQYDLTFHLYIYEKNTKLIMSNRQ